MIGELASRARRALGPELARLCRPRPALYWGDLTLSMTLGWCAFVGAARAEPLGAVQLAACGVALLAWLRGLVFVHEIAHRRDLPGFETYWNALVGIPLCVPSSLYVDTHPHHHETRRYATRADPEYADIAGWGAVRRVLFVAAGAAVPTLLALRFGVLTPLSLLLPGLRPFVIARCTTLGINPEYARDVSLYRRRPARLGLELACASTVWVAVAALALGVVSWAWAIQWAAVGGGAFAVNQLRTLAAHTYTRFGEALDHDGQFRDSIHLEASPLAWLVAPLGLRYHALHHLLPQLPYHSLGRVHRVLSWSLSDYRPRSRSTSWKSVVASAPSATGVAPISAATSSCSKQ